MTTDEREDARAAAFEALGELAEEMTAAEVIRDLLADRLLLREEVRMAQELLVERGRALHLRRPPGVLRRRSRIGGS